MVGMFPRIISKACFPPLYTNFLLFSKLVSATSLEMRIIVFGLAVLKCNIWRFGNYDALIRSGYFLDFLNPFSIFDLQRIFLCINYYYQNVIFIRVF
jgi:hypothetical protein